MVDKLNKCQQQFGGTKSKNKQIPMEDLDQDGNVNCNISVVLDKWKQDVSSLYNCSFIDNDSCDIHCSDILNKSENATPELFAIYIQNYANQECN